MKSLNVSISVRYPKMIPLFQDFAHFWWKERSKYENDDPMRDFCKLMPNSLYGGFGKRIPTYSYSGPVMDLFKRRFGSDLEKYHKFLEGKRKIERDRVDENGSIVPYIDLMSNEKFDAQTCFPVIPSLHL